MEETVEGTEFLLPSNGHCFVCLEQRSNLKKGKGTKKGLGAGLSSTLLGPSPGEGPNHSVLRLNHYLQINFGDLVSELVAVSAGALPLMERANVKVELCGNCALLVETFTRFHEQWEKIKMEMDCCLKAISLKMLEHPLERNNQDKLDIDAGEFHSKVLEKLRGEMSEKSNVRLQMGVHHSEPAPPVPNNFEEVPLNLKRDDTVMELVVDPFHDPNNPSSSSSSAAIPFMLSDLIHTSLSCETILLEEEVTSDPASTTTAVFRSPQQQDLYLGHIETTDNENNFKSAMMIMPTPPQPSSPPPTTTTSSRGKKLQCEFCQKFFSTQNNLRVHQQSIHFGRKFTCTLCQKDFTFKTNLEFHKKAQHGLVKKNGQQLVNLDTQQCSSATFQNHQASHHPSVYDAPPPPVKQTQAPRDSQRKKAVKKQKGKKKGSNKPPTATLLLSSTSPPPKPVHNVQCPTCHLQFTTKMSDVYQFHVKECQSQHLKSSPGKKKRSPVMEMAGRAVPAAGASKSTKDKVCRFCSGTLGKNTTMKWHKKFNCAYFKKP